MKFKKNRIKSDEISLSDDKKRNISIDWGRQGGVIIAYIIVLLGFFGIIANTIMIDRFGNWISFTEMDRTILIWPYLTYIQNFFLPLLLLFFICFLLTYKEDIPHYGIKASLWLVPFIVAQGFVFYWIMFGFSFEPFILQFLFGEGYVNVLILFGTALTGALIGMKVKQIIVKKRKSF
jgi:hypothetical protein